MQCALIGTISRRLCEYKSATVRHLHYYSSPCFFIGTMLGFLRKVCGVIVQVWLCLVGVFCRLFRQPKDPAHSAPQYKTPSWDGNTSWDNWDAAEPFSVTVVPSNCHGDDGVTPKETDLFQDMQPVIKKTRKVKILVTCQSPVTTYLLHLMLTLSICDVF